MKVGIYSPYLPDHFGGGEKYIFDVAKFFVDRGDDVSMLLNQARLPKNFQADKVQAEYEQFLGISLAGIQFVPSPIGTAHSFLQTIQFTKQFDVMYLVTDGSLFFSLAAKNILHVQIPFTTQQNGLLNKAKLANWSIKNSNSAFTKKIVEKSWSTQIPFVHYPMIDLPQASYEKAAKKKIIVNVGRFFDHLHSKRQDVLVTGFQMLCQQYPKELSGWKLVLAGPAEDLEYAQKIAKQAEGLAVEIHHQLDRTELLKLYQQATFYWHAAGYHVDELAQPEKVEHFGITTVEAMNYGVVPLVVGKGGQTEVLGDSMKSLLWQEIPELVERTSQLIMNQAEREEIAELAVQQAKNFGRTRFTTTLEAMLK